MKTITSKVSALSALFLMTTNLAVGQQCADNSAIYSFVYNGKTYEIVKENKSWIAAADCAVARGGILTEINDAAEQNAIFNELTSNANINFSNTIAPDGGGGSYIWIGGNDLFMEGNWVWDGDNDNSGTQFWMGTTTGSPLGGLYNNWGNEPDNNSSAIVGQDALGLSLNGWPLGVAGEWNDIEHTNALYYIVEHTTIVGNSEVEFSNKIKLYPNPIVDYITIESDEIDLQTLTIFNSLGQELEVNYLETNAGSKTVDLSHLNDGVYFIKVNSPNGKSAMKKITKSSEI